MDNSILYLKDLTDKVVYFISIVNEENWNIESLDVNSPLYIRLQQIEAMITAFCGAGISLKSFVNGNFIEGRPIQQYTGLAEEMNDYLELFVEDYCLNTKGVRLLMAELMNYKQRLYAAFGFLRPGTVICHSVYCDYMDVLITRHTPCLRDIMVEVDEMIEKVVQPKRISYSLQELIDDYNYPENDLDPVDIQYIFE